MSDAIEKGPTGFAGKRGKLWALGAWWLVPAVMTGAYIVLMMTSETDVSGKAWESIGLAFVLVLWFMFRLLTENAALHRALAVGDTVRVLEIADQQLARRRSPAARAPYHVYRAQAFEQRGQHAEAVAELAHAKPEAIGGTRGMRWQVEAAATRVEALIGLARTAEARAELARIEPLATKLDARLHAQTRIVTDLARGRVLLAEGNTAAAHAEIQKVLDDVRTGDALRTRARALLG